MQTETGINQRFAAQLPRNLAANIAYFLVNVVIGVLLVPYFINTLGVAAYGIIPLATSITGYVAIVVQSLTRYSHTQDEAVVIAAQIMGLGCQPNYLPRRTFRDN